ncbi:MAG: carboxypeptidase-like regulatory domain-containing protein [Xenococcaceae cyanobacterium]
MSAKIAIDKNIGGKTKTQNSCLIMTERKTSKHLAFLIFFSILGFSRQVFAHGANIVYRQISAIEVTATYEDGTPMDNAQVVIYAPDNPAIPWLKGTTDAEGKFSFIPASNVSGNWDVKIRQSGHGDIVSIPWQADDRTTGVESTDNVADGDKTILSTNSNYTPMQKIVMAATGVWGFVGTALYFSRQKS